MIVIDTNSDCSHKIHVLTAGNVGAVGRYYSTTHPDYCITKKEAEKISAAGIMIFAIFEDTASPQLTQAQGKKDAQAALLQAKAIGQPHGSAIYFTVEGLPDGYDVADLPAIKEYFKGVTSVIKQVFKIGVYSDGVVCDSLLTADICHYAWLSASTAFPGSAAFYQSGRWALFQTVPVDQDWEGLSVDVDEAKPDFGAFTIPFAGI